MTEPNHQEGGPPDQSQPTIVNNDFFTSNVEDSGEVNNVGEIEDPNAIYDWGGNVTFPHPLGFKEAYEFKIKEGMNPDWVQRRRRPCPGSIIIVIGKVTHKFDDVNIKLSIAEDQIPTFAIQAMVNPKKSSFPNEYRKFSVDFAPCDLDLACEHTGKAIQWSLNEGSANATFNVNYDAPDNLPQHAFETFMHKNAKETMKFQFTAGGDTEFMVQWGVTYWFRDLAYTRHSQIYRIRKWANGTDNALIQQYLEQIRTIKTHEVEVDCLESVRKPGYWTLKFKTPQSFRGSIGCLLALIPPEDDEDHFLNTAPPHPMLRTRIPTDGTYGDYPWIGVVSMLDFGNETTEVLLLSGVDLPLPPKTKVQFRALPSEVELQKSQRVRQHTYLKCIPIEVALEESTGIKNSANAVKRHTFDLKPFILTGFEFPPRDNEISNYRIEDFPNKKRDPNEKQREAIEKLRVNCCITLVVNGPPGTGKTFLGAMMAAHAMKLMKWKVMATAPGNKQVDNFLKRVVSTYIHDYSDNEVPHFVRVVAPGRSYLGHLIDSHITGDEPDPTYRQYDLDFQALTGFQKLAESGEDPAKSEAQHFLRLHSVMQTTGYFDDSADRGKYERLKYAMEKHVLSKAKAIFVTCSMASYPAVVEMCQNVNTAPHMSITDESASARIDQSLAPIVYNPYLKAIIMLGDPAQKAGHVFGDASVEGSSAWALSNTLHEHLVNSNFPGVVQLSVQHRMEAKLANFPNKYFYGGKLETHKSVTDGRPRRKEIRDLIGKDNSSKWNIEFGDKKFMLPQHENHIIDVTNGEAQEDPNDSTYNLPQITTAVVLYLRLIELGINTDAIYVISPYMATVMGFSHALKTAKKDAPQPNVFTVDSVPGEEADVVIFITAKDYNSTKTGFMKDDKRVCTALTRNRYFRFVITSMEFWTRPDLHQCAMTAFHEYGQKGKLVTRITVPGFAVREVEVGPETLPSHLEPSNAMIRNLESRTRPPRPARSQPLRPVSPELVIPDDTVLNALQATQQHASWIDELKKIDFNDMV